MKQIAFLLFALVAISSCRQANLYDNVCIDEITIDGEPAPEEYYDAAVERLSQTALHVLSADEAAQQTPAQRLRTLEIGISIESKRNSVEADVTIENHQTGRNVWETEAKSSVEREDPTMRALTKALRKTAVWLERFNNETDI